MLAKNFQTTFLPFNIERKVFRYPLTFYDVVVVVVADIAR